MGTPHIIEAANLGMADSLILMVMALVVFGPRRLPQIGRQIGKLMYEFRKASNDFKYQMEEELRSAEEADRRKKEEERQKEVAQTVPATSEAAETPNPYPSPYDGEEVYPPEILRTEETSSAAESVQAQAGAEEKPLRVEPPSVGEQVPAARPWNLEEKLAELNIPGPEAGSSEEIKKAAAESTPTNGSGSSPAAEQAAHHG